MTYEDGSVTDDSINFFGRAWPSPNGRFVVTSGSVTRGLDTRVVLLYNNGVQCWRADPDANANECAVCDIGMCILSFDRERRGGIAVISAAGALVANHTLSEYATCPAISASAAVVAWRTVDGIVVARLRPWAELKKAKFDWIPDAIRIREETRELIATDIEGKKHTMRF